MIAYTTEDAGDLLGTTKSLIKSTYGKKKYRQIRADVLNYVKQYMEKQNDLEQR